MKTGLEEQIKQNIVDNYDRYYRLAFTYVRNEQDALDVVQEGAYKAILYGNSLRKPEYMSTWIYRIMINEALAFIKKRPATAELEEGIEHGREDTYESIDMKRAIDSLGEPEATIIRLRFFEDLKIDQIAEILKENVNTIKTKLYRSLKKLKLELSEEDMYV